MHFYVPPNLFLNFCNPFHTRFAMWKYVLFTLLMANPFPFQHRLSLNTTSVQHLENVDRRYCIFSLAMWNLGKPWGDVKYKVATAKKHAHRLEFSAKHKSLTLAQCPTAKLDLESIGFIIPGPGDISSLNIEEPPHSLQKIIPSLACSHTT